MGKERINLFFTREKPSIFNPAAGVVVKADERNMFLECILNEKQAYNDSVGSRLESEPWKPFDFVPRSIFKTVILTKKLLMSTWTPQRLLDISV